MNVIAYHGVPENGTLTSIHNGQFLALSRWAENVSLRSGDHGYHVAARVKVSGSSDTTLSESTLNALLFVWMKKKDRFGVR